MEIQSGALTRKDLRGVKERIYTGRSTHNINVIQAAQCYTYDDNHRSE